MKKKEELKNDKKEPKNNKNKFKKVIQEERKVEENIEKEEKFKNVMKKQYYNYSYQKALLEFQSNNNHVLVELNNLINNILSYQENLSKYSIELKKNIEDYIQSLNDINRIEFNPHNQNVLNNKQNYIDSIKNVFDKYRENLIFVCDNKYLSKIKDLNETLGHNRSDISELDFNPPNVNSFNNSSINKEDSDSYCFYQFEEENNIENIFEGYEDFKEENISNDNNNSGHLKKSIKDISINNNNNNLDKKEKQKITFLDSMSIAIKYFLMCCDGTLNKKKKVQLKIIIFLNL